MMAAALALAALPAAAFSQVAVPNEDSAKPAEAHAIIDIAFPPAQRQRTFDTLLTTLNTQFHGNLDAQSLGDPGLRAILEREFDNIRPQQSAVIQKHMPQIFEASAIAYTHEFSLAEVRDIHAFASSLAGKHYLSRSTALLGDPAVAQANASLFADAQALAASVRAEVTEKVVTYLKAHPDVAQRISAQTRAAQRAP